MEAGVYQAQLSPAVCDRRASKLTDGFFLLVMDGWSSVLIDTKSPIK